MSLGNFRDSPSPYRLVSGNRFVADALLDFFINPATISMRTVRSVAEIVANDCKFHVWKSRNMRHGRPWAYREIRPVKIAGTKTKE